MAEGKKTVVVYADWGEIFDKLENDEAGRLIKHFFNYVRDQDPIAPDRITDILFQPIKNQLKRDLKSWNATKADKSIAGRLGNLKRWHYDLYKQVVKEKLTLEEAEAIAGARKKSHTDDNSSHTDKKESHPITNIAVNDTVTVNDIKENNANASFLSLFDEFRKLFPGTKRGNVTEFENFKKRHKDWKTALPLLTPAVNAQIASRAKKHQAAQFVPEWKNLQTWINQRCWEEVIEGAAQREIKSLAPDTNSFFNTGS